MKTPGSKEEALEAARQYRKWSASFSAENPTRHAPSFMAERINEVGTFKLLAGLLTHFALLVARGLFFRLGLWTLAQFCAELRIKTDDWSGDEAECGLSEAHTMVGMCRLKRGDLSGAIEALNCSWKVWPCPHNTTYGFDTRLARALSKHPEAEGPVRDFLEVSSEFRL